MECCWSLVGIMLLIPWESGLTAFAEGGMPRKTCQRHLLQGVPWENTKCLLDHIFFNHIFCKVSFVFKLHISQTCLFFNSLKKWCTKIRTLAQQGGEPVVMFETWWNCLELFSPCEYWRHSISCLCDELRLASFSCLCDVLKHLTCWIVLKIIKCIPVFTFWVVSWTLLDPSRRN